ncbi:MAG: hypothetical protein JXA42_13935 [Anaerolineales bacterium]|nr:hypothetical protein [Anaerolineales bacterium]
MLTDLIERLAKRQALQAAGDISRIERVLKTALDTYTELEFHSDGRRIDLITVSGDPNMRQAFFELLEQRGVNETAIAGSWRFLQFGRGKTTIYKLPVAGPSVGGEVYIRGALPLDEVINCLEHDSVGGQALEGIQKTANLMGKNHTRMLGRDVAEQARYTAFITTHLKEGQEETDSRLFQQWLPIAGVNESGLELLMAAHALFSPNRPKTLFFSLQAAAGEQGIQAKLDYEGVQMKWVTEIMRWAGQDEAAVKLVEWSRELGLNKASYAGMPLCQDGIEGFRIYFRLH